MLLWYQKYPIGAHQYNFWTNKNTHFILGFHEWYQTFKGKAIIKQLPTYFMQQWFVQFLNRNWNWSWLSNIKWYGRAWVGNLKQRVLITSKSSNFKSETLCSKIAKDEGARQYCPKVLRVPGTLGTHYWSPVNNVGLSNWMEMPFKA